MAQMSAAAGTLFLGPNQYRMVPLTNEDLDEYMAWVRAEHVNEAGKAARASAIPLTGDEKEDLKIIAQNKEEEQRMKDRAFDQACGTTMASGLTLATMVTPRGVAKLLWFGLQRHHPEVDTGEILREVMDPDVMNAALDEYDRLNSSKDDVKKKLTDGERVRRRERRKKQRERRKAGR